MNQMKKHLITILVFVHLFFCTIMLQAQKNSSSPKSLVKIEDFDFDQEEMKIMRKNGVTTYSDNEKKELGLIDFQTVRYDFSRKPDAEFTQLLFVSVLPFSDKRSLKKKLDSLDQEDIFTPYRNHTFMIGDKTLVYFYLGAYRIGEEYDSRMYLNLLNHYRERLKAKLILTPKSGFNEQSYFNSWSLMLGSR
jgi:hypothetical protein